MSNMNTLIMNAKQYGNSEALIQIKEKLEQQIKELDVFFEEYLELFSDEMSAIENEEPVWKAYKDKLKEYSIAKQNLNITEYYLRGM